MNPDNISIRPLFDRIIVNDPEAGNVSNKTSHGENILDGIVIPTSAEDQMKAMAKRASDRSPHYVLTALAVGESCKLVKKGDRIVVAEMGLFRVKVGDVQFCGVGEGNVVAVLS